MTLPVPAHAEPMAARWRLGVAGAFLLLAVYACGFLTTRAQDLRPSDDNIWLYVTGAEMREPARARALRAVLAEGLRDRAETDEAAMRYDIRIRYRDNYRTFSWLIGRVAVLSGAPGIENLDEYARALGRAILAATTLAATFSIVALVGGLVLTRDPLLLVGMAATSGLLLLTTMASEPGYFIVFEKKELSAVASNLLRFVINPGPQFTMFGFTPRSFLFVLTPLVFAWRWHGWWAASYVLLALLLFVHQSLAGLLLITLVTLDAAMRPRTLFRAPVLAPVVAAAVLFAARETLWQYIVPSSAGGWIAVGASAGAVLAAAVVTLPLWRRAGASAWSVGRGLRKRFIRLSPWSTDGLALFGLWVLTLPLGYAIALHVGPLEGKYFWFQLHARLFSLFLPAMAFALVVALLAAHWRRVETRGGVLVLVLAGVVAASIPLARRPDHSPFLNGLVAVARTTTRPIVGRIGEQAEPAIYMAVAYDLDHGAMTLARLLDVQSPPAGEVRPSSVTEPHAR